MKIKIKSFGIVLIVFMLLCMFISSCADTQKNRVANNIISIAANFANKQGVISDAQLQLVKEVQAEVIAPKTILPVVSTTTDKPAPNELLPTIDVTSGK